MRPVSRASSAGWSWISPSTFMIVTSWSVTTSASKAARIAPIRSSRSRRTCRHQAGGKGSPGPIAARMFQVATRRRAGEADAPVTNRLLDRAREEALDEVALEAEEHEEGNDHQEER